MCLKPAADSRDECDVINCSDVISALLRFNTTEENKDE